MSLALDNVTVVRGDRAILSEMSFAAHVGEVLAIVGPNGAGKSTALGVASGALKPNEGRVLLDGRPLADFKPVVLARRRAVVPQSAQIAFPFRVHEIVAFGRAPHRGSGSAVQDAQIVDQAIVRFDLASFADRDVTTLSGGERQRVHLARAFAQVWTTPEDAGDRWLLLDEPTAALDPAHQIAALSAASQFAKSGGGAVIVLHDLRLAAAYADRVAVMRGGRLVTIGTPADALTLSRICNVFALAERDARLFIEDAPGSEPSPDRAALECKFISRSQPR